MNTIDTVVLVIVIILATTCLATIFWIITMMFLSDHDFDDEIEVDEDDNE